MWNEKGNGGIWFVDRRVFLYLIGLVREYSNVV
jgi:hypothetical protein